MILFDISEFDETHNYGIAFINSFVKQVKEDVRKHTKQYPDYVFDKLEVNYELDENMRHIYKTIIHFQT